MAGVTDGALTALLFPMSEAEGVVGAFVETSTHQRLGESPRTSLRCSRSSLLGG